MTPTTIHRYTIPLRDAVEALIGDAVGDCEGWSIHIEGTVVVVDVFAPVPGVAPTVADVTSIASNEAARISTPFLAPAGANETVGAPEGPATPEAPPAEPERPKGGPLARRAAILCGHGGFQAWLEVRGPDEAKAEVCRRCGVESRAELDHSADAAAAWRDMETRYQLWLDGYDG